jgi:hypothetical protein
MALPGAAQSPMRRVSGWLEPARNAVRLDRQVDHRGDRILFIICRPTARISKLFARHEDWLHHAFTKFRHRRTIRSRGLPNNHRGR